MDLCITWFDWGENLVTGRYGMTPATEFTLLTPCIGTVLAKASRRM